LLPPRRAEAGELGLSPEEMAFHDAIERLANAIVRVGSWV
jgi:hypothetical protein